MRSEKTHKGNKSFLPSKLCVSCGKEFVWRKKWERDWEQVLYCSHRCKASRGMGSKNDK